MDALQSENTCNPTIENCTTKFNNTFLATVYAWFTELKQWV